MKYPDKGGSNPLGGGVNLPEIYALLVKSVSANEAILATAVAL